MTDTELADELIDRLNALLGTGAEPAMRALLGTRVPVALDPDHPTIQVDSDGGPTVRVSFLGMLNGVVGVLPDDGGPHAGWGWIGVTIAEDGSLVRFVRTDRFEKES